MLTKIKIRLIGRGAAVVIFSGISISAVNAQSLFGGGGSFYNFAPGGGGLGDILGDVELGSLLGGDGDILGDILNGNTGTIIDDVFGGVCGNFGILNIAPDYDCEADPVGGNSDAGNIFGGVIENILNGGGDRGITGVFGDVFGTVAGDLGIPSEITDVIMGRRGVEDLFSDILNEALEELGLEGETDVAGAQGIPIYDDLMELLSKGASGTTGMDGIPVSEAMAQQPSPGLLTPNVNPALIRPVQTLEMITGAVTDKVLSAEGQAVSAARTTAGQTIIETSGALADSAAMIASAQTAVATSLATEIDAQTSTQDTLKVALAGLNQLRAQSTQFDALASNQRALGNRMGAMQLDVAQELSASSAVGARSLQMLNQQEQSRNQKELAAEASIYYEHAPAIRSMGVAR